jgi:hypothetical protein
VTVPIARHPIELVKILYTASAIPLRSSRPSASGGMMGRAFRGRFSLMLGLKVLVENITRRLLLGTWLNVTVFVGFTNQRQLVKGTLQTHSFPSMVSLYRTAFPKLPHKANASSSPCLCIRPFLFSKTTNCPGECLGHPIVHYIAAEHSCEDIPSARAESWRGG